MSVADSLHHGLFVHHALARLRRLGVSINPFYLFREGASVPEADALDGIATEVLTEETAQAVVGLTAWSSTEEVARRLQRGHVCVVLRSGDDVAGYTWADLEEVNDSACNYRLEPGAAYLYDAFVSPTFRGRNLASTMRAVSYEVLRQRGIDTFYSVSDRFNTPAIKFKQRLNADRVCLYLQIKVGSQEIGNWVVKRYDSRTR